MSRRLLEPPTKRSQLDLDNSDDLNGLNDTLEIMLKEVESKKEASNMDIVSLLSTFIRRDIAKESRERELRNKVVEIEEKTLEHDVQIECVQNNFKSMQSKQMKLERANNIHDQKLIDNDIFVSFFPMKPNCDAVSKALISLAKIPLTALADSYCIPLKPQPNANSTHNATAPSVKYAMIITFTQFNFKRQFLTARKNLGPIKMTQLIENCNQPNVTIKATNRLSSFNLRVLKGLSCSKSSGSISDFNFRNGLFRLKKASNSNWVQVATDDDLEDVTKSDDVSL